MTNEELEMRMMDLAPRSDGIGSRPTADEKPRERTVDEAGMGPNTG
jgi:hypothetical protein